MISHREFTNSRSEFGRPLLNFRKLWKLSWRGSAFFANSWKGLGSANCRGVPKNRQKRWFFNHFLEPVGWFDFFQLKNLRFLSWKLTRLFKTHFSLSKKVKSAYGSRKVAFLKKVYFLSRVKMVFYTFLKVFFLELGGDFRFFSQKKSKITIFFAFFRIFEKGACGT